LLFIAFGIVLVFQINGISVTFQSGSRSYLSLRMLRYTSL